MKSQGQNDHQDWKEQNINRFCKIILERCGRIDDRLGNMALRLSKLEERFYGSEQDQIALRLERLSSDMRCINRALNSIADNVDHNFAAIDARLSELEDCL